MRNGLAGHVSSLRWVGLEEKAEQLEKELEQQPAIDTVLAIQSETDYAAAGGHPPRCSISRCYCNEKARMPRPQIIGGGTWQVMVRPNGQHEPDGR